MAGTGRARLIVLLAVAGVLAGCGLFAYRRALRFYDNLGRTNKTIENPERPLSAAERLPVPKSMDREDRLRALEDQVEQILRELQRLRKER